MPISVKKRTEAVEEIQLPREDRVFRAFFVNLNGRTVLVDTGVPETAQELARTVAERQPEMVVITHAHPDHIGGLQLLADELPELTVACHREEAEFSWPDTGEPAIPVQVDRKLEDDEEVIPGLRVIHVPGHTPGNIALLVETEGTLLAGDCVFGVGSHGRTELSAPPTEFSLEPEKANANVRLLLEHDFERVLLSHGEHLLTEAREQLSELVASL
jgi:glyoxylase-like metal-dependent hydrolase (beta-lactamase superfamily II)